MLPNAPPRKSSPQSSSRDYASRDYVSFSSSTGSVYDEEARLTEGSFRESSFRNSDASGSDEDQKGRKKQSLWPFLIMICLGCTFLAALPVLLIFHFSWPSSSEPACADTVGWQNGQNYTCDSYVHVTHWCSDGAISPAAVWSGGRGFNYPQLNCCGCGKASLPQEKVIDYPVGNASSNISNASVPKASIAVTSMIIHGIDYDQILAFPLTGPITKCIKAAVVRQVGSGVGEDNVKVDISKGSVVVKITITPPIGVNAPSLEQNVSSPAFLKTLVTKVYAVPGVSIIASQALNATVIPTAPQAHTAANATTVQVAGWPQGAGWAGNPPCSSVKDPISDACRSEVNRLLNDRSGLATDYNMYHSANWYPICSPDAHTADLNNCKEPDCKLPAGAYDGVPPGTDSLPIATTPGFQGHWPNHDTTALEFENMQFLVHLKHPKANVCPLPCFDPKAASFPMKQSTSKCPPTPPKLPSPTSVLQYNGKSWPAMCFEGRDVEHVFIIGDWGGWLPGEPADNSDRQRHNAAHERPFVYGMDDSAQLQVAQQFMKLAAKLAKKQEDPRYVLNVGDNFYWGGCYESCATRSIQDHIKVFSDDNSNENINNCSHQFYSVFETMYMGPGVDGKPWISCLGNHDYGGYYFNAAWDQQIAYTWGPSGRWVMPALYYHQYVAYPTKNFSVDYYILDTNVGDVKPADQDPHHNMCNRYRNPTSNCAPFGPRDADHCVQWFHDLWKEQVTWLEKSLKVSTADWQIIMTHFPPETCVYFSQMVLDLARVGNTYGIDLFVSGHRHIQSLFETGYTDGFADTAGIPYVVSGGGGGITADYTPSYLGDGQDMYGFMDMIMTKSLITIEAINQVGVSRGIMKVKQRAWNVSYCSMGGYGCNPSD